MISNVNAVKHEINNNLRDNEIIDFVIHIIKLTDQNRSMYPDGEGIYIHKYNNQLGKTLVSIEFFTDDIINSNNLNIPTFTRALCNRVKTIGHLLV